MPLTHFRFIRGAFQVAGFKPDGDSVRFLAPGEPFQDLYNVHKADLTKGCFQLRLEGIDAPETHYGAEHQPLGDEARDHLMHLLGAGELVLESQRVLRCANDRIPGAILTRSFDAHGRPISYALVGDDIPGHADGSVVEVDETLLTRTLNARMVAAGFAYPLLYTSTPMAHRSVLRKLAKAARDERLGVWRHDVSKEFRLRGRESIAGHFPGEAAGADGPWLIYPKFFRRCIDYLRQVAAGQFAGDFPAWLAAAGRENDSVVLRDLELRMSTLFEQRNSRIRCQADVLDMVFVEK